MQVRLLVALSAALALGSTAVAGKREDRQAKELAEALAGRNAGPAERCVPSQRLNTPQVVGRTLLYRDGATTWRNDVPDCVALGRDPILIVEMFGDRMCENDRFRTIERGGARIPGPYCQLGKFVPYRKPQ